jgi:hypothetical protein
MLAKEAANICATFGIRRVREIESAAYALKGRRK